MGIQAFLIFLLLLLLASVVGDLGYVVWLFYRRGH